MYVGPDDILTIFYKPLQDKKWRREVKVNALEIVYIEVHEFIQKKR